MTEHYLRIESKMRKDPIEYTHAGELTLSKRIELYEKEKTANIKMISAILLDCIPWRFDNRIVDILDMNGSEEIIKLFGWEIEGYTILQRSKQGKMGAVVIASLYNPDKRECLHLNYTSMEHMLGITWDGYTDEQRLKEIEKYKLLGHVRNDFRCNSWRDDQ